MGPIKPIIWPRGRLLKPNVSALPHRISIQGETKWALVGSGGNLSQKNVFKSQFLTQHSKTDNQIQMRGVIERNNKFVSFKRILCVLQMSNVNCTLYDGGGRGLECSRFLIDAGGEELFLILTAKAHEWQQTSAKYDCPQFLTMTKTIAVMSMVQGTD